MNKLQRIEEMEKQLAALRAEVEQEEKPKRWEPKEGDWFYYSNGVGKITTSEDARDYGIERQTREQAEDDYKLARAYNRLLAYKAEFDADFVPDWGSSFRYKHYVFFDNNDGQYKVGFDMVCQNICKVHFSEQAAKELARKLNSGEVVL